MTLLGLASSEHSSFSHKYKSLCGAVVVFEEGLHTPPGWGEGRLGLVDVTQKSDELDIVVVSISLATVGEDAEKKAIVVFELSGGRTEKGAETLAAGL